MSHPSVYGAGGRQVSAFLLLSARHASELEQHDRNHVAAACFRHTAFSRSMPEVHVLLKPTVAILALFGAAVSIPALAQDKSITGQNTILPGTGPGTSIDGKDGSRLMQAADADAATKRQGLKPITFLASKMIGVEVRNPAGDSIGKIEDLMIVDGGTLRAVVLDVGGFLGVGSRHIAVEPSALVLRPGGDRFSAVLNMSKDTIAAASTFKPDEALKAQ